MDVFWNCIIPLPLSLVNVVQNFVYDIEMGVVEGGVILQLIVGTWKLQLHVRYRKTFLLSGWIIELMGFNSSQVWKPIAAILWCIDEVPDTRTNLDKMSRSYIWSAQALQVRRHFIAAYITHTCNWVKVNHQILESCISPHKFWNFKLKLGHQSCISLHYFSWV